MQLIILLLALLPVLARAATVAVIDEDFGFPRKDHSSYLSGYDIEDSEVLQQLTDHLFFAYPASRLPPGRDYNDESHGYWVSRAVLAAYPAARVRECSFVRDFTFSYLVFDYILHSDCAKNSQVLNISQAVNSGWNSQPVGKLADMIRVHGGVVVLALPNPGQESMLAQKLVGADNVILAYDPALPNALPEWAVHASNLAMAPGRSGPYLGNSFAAAHVAGLISYWIDRGMTPRDAARKMLRASTPHAGNP